MYKGSEEIVAFLSARRGVKTTFNQVAEGTKLNADSVRRAIEWLKENGYVTVELADEREIVTATEEFRGYYFGGKMPEYAVYQKAQASARIGELSDSEKGIGLRWAKVKGYIDIKEGTLIPLKDEEQIKRENQKYIEAYMLLERGEQIKGELREELQRRKLIEKSREKTTYIEYTGKELHGAEYDLQTPSKMADIGIRHPLSVISARIKQIFAELGFEEMEGSIIQSSFWNFDALFQPQDHPARELADTFYLEGETGLPPDKKLVERVKKAHEAGWKYSWQEAEAKRLVLRTHTTALSAQYLERLTGKNEPKKYFAIGRVFRNEATDYKHLAEFQQVEGIVAWEGATFRDLLGLLKEFYRKLGFEKIRFRPSFFPYTEPSLEIEVFFEPRKQWLELGGAGIFRPEVSKPLAGIYPVLAWGVSLERPLMLLLGMEDVREFYRNDLDFLKKKRLPC